jgi:hypothetical protein
MFSCEKCGSSYSPIRAAGLENCPRCRIRDRIAVPLTFKAFQLPAGGSPASLAKAPASSHSGAAPSDEMLSA